MNHTDNQQSHWSSPCMCCVTPRGFTDITECKLVYDRRPWCAERAREADTVASLGHKVSELGGGKRRNLFGWGPQNLKQIWTRATMGAEQSAKRRRLKASVVDISQHKQLRAAAFVPPRRTSFHSPSSFGSPVTMQVLVLLWQVQFVLFAVRMSVVYRRERKKKKKSDQMEKAIVPQRPEEIPSSDSKQDEIIFYLPESFLCMETCLLSPLSTDPPAHSTSQLKHLQTLQFKHGPGFGSQKCRTTAWRANEQVGTKGFRCDLNYRQSPYLQAHKGTEHAIRTAHR